MRGWPAELTLVRHGESEGNLANAAAYAARAERLDLTLADPLVPLSELGVRQAVALGRRLGEETPPDVCVVSPYLRTQQTADHLLAAAGWTTSVPRLTDERLRDREQGILDRLTSFGVRRHYPAEAERREALGKFYYRPPGGESWADVALRIRSLLSDLRADRSEQRLLVVTHDVPILVFRYLLESLAATDAVTLSGEVVNCGLTRYTTTEHGPRLRCFNDATPLEADESATVTAHEEQE